MVIKNSYKISLFLLFLSGCANKPITTEKTNNSNIDYEVLFIRHGCEIGRFNDNRYVYITICPNGNSLSETMYMESCGKNCIKSEIQTNTQSSTGSRTVIPQCLPK